MRKKLFTNESFRGFITLVCMLLSASVAFAQKIVHVEEAGTLKDKLTEEEMLSLTELTLTGNLNGTDILFIRAMGGSTIAGGKPMGNCRYLTFLERTLWQVEMLIIMSMKIWNTEQRIILFQLICFANATNCVR